MYLEGRGVQVDPLKAHPLLVQAAQKGHSDAKLILRRNYRNWNGALYYNPYYRGF
jgi:TPR repeat protein